MKRLLNQVEWAFMLLAQCSVGCMMVVISWDAIGRYLFHRPLAGQVEFTERYLLVILVFMALAGTYSSGGHVRIDSILQIMPATARKIAGVFVNLVALAAFMLFAYATMPVAIAKFSILETTFGAVQFPVYLSYVWVPLGVVAMCLRLISDLIEGSNPPAADGLELDE